jgi:hypothetical protein
LDKPKKSLVTEPEWLVRAVTQALRHVRFYLAHGYILSPEQMDILRDIAMEVKKDVQSSGVD